VKGEETMIKQLTLSVLVLLVVGSSVAAQEQPAPTPNEPAKKQLYGATVVYDLSSNKLSTVMLLGEKTGHELVLEKLSYDVNMVDGSVTINGTILPSFWEDERLMVTEAYKTLVIPMLEKAASLWSAMQELEKKQQKEKESISPLFRKGQ
jgi:hypothetical protein